MPSLPASLQNGIQLIITKLAEYGLSYEGFKIASTTLVTYILGIMAYSIFIFKFYRLIAERDILHLDLNKYDYSKYEMVKKAGALSFYIIIYFIIFPLIAFFGFLVLSALLSLMAQRSVESIMVISMAIVGTVRVIAYYKEDLARDLAKMLPFTLLGILIIDVSAISFGTAFEKIISLFNSWHTMVYYFIFIVLVEMVLTFSHRIYTDLKPKKEEEGEEESAEE